MDGEPKPHNGEKRTKRLRAQKLNTACKALLCNDFTLFWNSQRTLFLSLSNARVTSLIQGFFFVTFSKGYASHAALTTISSKSRQWEVGSITRGIEGAPARARRNTASHSGTPTRLTSYGTLLRDRSPLSTWEIGSEKKTLWDNDHSS